LPSDLPISVEVVNFEQEARHNTVDWAATCMKHSQTFVA
jgi:hypothetical protein